MAEEASRSERGMTLEEFLPTVPRDRRGQILAQVMAHFRERERVSRWVSQRVRETFDVPDILYKYVPSGSLEFGCPLTLRATQPVALNDVMEGNISTYQEGPKVDRDWWYEMLGERLREIFGEDSLSPEELERRKRLYGDPRVSTIIRDYLSRYIGVVSFSADPLIPTMWAYYAQNSGFVVGYRTEALRSLGVGLRRVLYMELAPAFCPTRGGTIELNFVDEARRKAEPDRKGTPILDTYGLLTLEKDWRTLSDLLFVKGDSWKSEREIRLLVDQETTRATGEVDANGHRVKVLDVAPDAIEEVYVGFNTTDSAVRRIRETVNDCESDRRWKLKRTDSHAYRMQVTITSINNRRGTGKQG